MTTSTNRRSIFLHEMGLGPVWMLRNVVVEDAAPIETQVEMQAEPISIPAIEEHSFAENFSSDTPPAFFDDIPWEEGAEVQEPTGVPNVANMDWDELEPVMLQCTACGLCQNRTQVVPGVGDRKAAWLFVGEGPGFYEDQQGEPFVGASGKLLDNMLRAMHLTRGENVYIANIVKCRPTDAGSKDRPPTLEEAGACRSFLDRQIALIQPEVIVALGRTAATMLLATEQQTSLTSLRGRVHYYRAADGNEIRLIATYHPAYLLRQLADKKKAWADLCMAMAACSSQD